jgi:hypothetical protein
MFLIGWAVGGLIFGALADRFGRARMLKITILLYSLSTGLNSFSTGFFDFCLWRLLAGIGIGGVFGVAVALVADSLPDRARATALGMMQAFGAFGNLAAGLAGMALGGLSARHGLPFHLKQWQVLFLVGALPALLCLLATRRLEEPAKWVNAREEGLKARGEVRLLPIPPGRPQVEKKRLAGARGLQRGHHRPLGRRQFPPQDSRLDRGYGDGGATPLTRGDGEPKRLLALGGLAPSEYRGILRLAPFHKADAGDRPSGRAWTRVASVVPVDGARLQIHAAHRPDVLDASPPWASGSSPYSEFTPFTCPSYSRPA